MPVFGIGTWKMGGNFFTDKNNADERDILAIKTAIELGVTHIDTAEVYGGGKAEELVAEAIDGYDREKLFIVSKVNPLHFAFKDVLKSCEASLKRLKTDYLDLYLLHAPNPLIPLEETMKAMDTLLDDGKIKHIGISNFAPETQKEAQSFTKNKIVVNQVHYNLIVREPETSGLLQDCQKDDLFLMAWRPVEKGLLAGSKIALVEEMCQKYSKTPAQIAINWLISQENVITLAKSSNLDHLKENLGGVGWNMAKEDVEKLRKEFPSQEEISNSVPLS